MANRNFNPVQTLGKGITLISGSFRPNGGSAIDNTLNTGIGWSVARSAQGVFTVTLQDPFNQCVAALATIAMSAATDIMPQLGAIDVSSAKTIVIRAIDSTATAQDIASNAANRVHFMLVLKNSSVTP